MADGYITTPVGPFHSAVGASFGTFTTRQDVSPTPVPVIPANQLRPGSQVRIFASGECSTTATPTLVLGFYVGTGVGASGGPAAITTVLAETAAISLATAAAWPWRLELELLVTALGTAGSVNSMGNGEMPTAIGAFSSVALPITQALRTVALNTAVPNAVGVCATYSASSASNTVRVNKLTAQLLN